MVLVVSASHHHHHQVCYHHEVVIETVCETDHHQVESLEVVYVDDLA